MDFGLEGSQSPPFAAISVGLAAVLSAWVAKATSSDHDGAVYRTVVYHLWNIDLDIFDRNSPHVSG